MSVTMGNAIRQLKLEISGSDIDMIEQDVRCSLSAFVRFNGQSRGVGERSSLSKN